MHISKRTSRQLTVKIYPRFCWSLAGFLGVAGVISALVNLFGETVDISLQTSLVMIVGAAIALAIAELRIYEFDRTRQALRIRRCWIWREASIEYPLASLVAVRLSSKTVSVEGYGGTGSRIELIFPNAIKPLTTVYSSDGTQRNVAIAIAELFNIEAQVPPTLGQAFRSIMNMFKN